MHVLSKQTVDQAFDEFPEERIRFQARLADHIIEHEKNKFGNGKGGVTLRRTTLFRDTTMDFLQQLWDKLETHLFMPDDVIVKEGEKSDPCMYIMRRGTASAYVKGLE